MENKPEKQTKIKTKVNLRVVRDDYPLKCQFGFLEDSKSKIDTSL